VEVLHECHTKRMSKTNLWAGALVSLGRLAPSIWLFGAVLAAIDHLMLLLGLHNLAMEVVRYLLLCMFVILCITFLSSQGQSADIKRLYGTVFRRFLLAGLAFVWIAYTALLICDNLGFSFAKSIFGTRLIGLWSTALCIWAFATESMFLRLKDNNPT
jgi:signal transduction histidine kinase